MASDKERDELLQRFISIIGEPVGSLFFDEDELIEIFDYAGDLNDDFIKMEVLWWGAKLYPDSSALAERKANLYYELGNVTAAKKILKVVPKESIMRRLLILKITNPPQNEVISELSNILEVIDDFKDEEIIQFVQTAGELHAYEWLKSQKISIQLKCSFPQTFLYELIGIAEENSDYDFIISLLEELTELEPFNSEFWEMTADYYNFHFNEPEKTLNAAEYALAIDPDAPKSIMLRAKALFDLKYPLSEIEGPLMQLIKRLPSDKAPVQILSMILAESNEKDRAISLISDYLDNHSGDRMMLSSLIYYSDGEINIKYLQDFYADQMPDSYSLINWAKDTLKMNFPAASISILELIPNSERKEEFFELYSEALFAARKYNQLLQLFKDKENNSLREIEDYSPRTTLLRILAECSIKRMSKSIREDLIQYIVLKILYFSSPSFNTGELSLSYSLEIKGIISILQEISSQLDKGKRVNPDKYNCYLQNIN